MSPAPETLQPWVRGYLWPCGTETTLLQAQREVKDRLAPVLRHPGLSPEDQVLCTHSLSSQRLCKLHTSIHVADKHSILQIRKLSSWARQCLARHRLNSWTYVALCGGAGICHSATLCFYEATELAAGPDNYRSWLCPSAISQNLLGPHLALPL